ncbi:hypothetical protein GLYMA_07G113000v4 [Glycine max]|uniref:Uncharacterized protein n=1 Tax=Glycine max TaxID=3847 RepID=A0A0R0J1V4_SOYBN|nr:hypothetical protein GYH30_018070 [Glycine max]KRH48797.1 hypothetical protein GLYMA_07G113000v4 [Glycine max]
MSMITGTLYDRIIKKRNIRDFNEFQIVILDIWELLGAPSNNHYDAPTHDDIENYYETRTKSEEAQKKEAFIKFVTENVNQSKADESMMISGIVTPPVAMEAKKTGQTVPQLSIIKAVPDVAFVPEATILALIAIKLTRKWHSRISHPFLKENDTPS